MGPPAASVSTGGDWRIPKQTPLPVDSHPPSSHSPVPQTPTMGAKDSAAAPDGAPWPAWHGLTVNGKYRKALAEALRTNKLT